MIQETERTFLVSEQPSTTPQLSTKHVLHSRLLLHNCLLLHNHLTLHLRLYSLVPTTTQETCQTHHCPQCWTSVTYKQLLFDQKAAHVKIMLPTCQRELFSQEELSTCIVSGKCGQRALDAKNCTNYKILL